MDNGRLFETDNPLEERLGKSFFEELPVTPGVYKMYSRESLLLYVGKAKNLRRRLFTYRRVKPGTGSRKVRRLIRMIRSISIEQLPTEQEALLRENELIRTNKPPFNRAKKSPETYYFISVVPDGESLVFDLRMHRKKEADDYTYGAFKGHRSVRRTLGALLRQLYIMEHNISCPFRLPPQLLNKLTPRHYKLMTSEPVKEHIRQFLGGTSDRLLFEIADHARRNKLLEQFIGKLILKDMEALAGFFKRSAGRNRKIIRQLGLKSHIIPQEKLDDYLVELSFRDG